MDYINYTIYFLIFLKFLNNEMWNKLFIANIKIYFNITIKFIINNITSVIF